MDHIDDEIVNRHKIWDELINKVGAERVSPTLIREIGIYGGAQGIYVDKNRTAPISPDGVGITVALLHTSSHYPDALTWMWQNTFKQ